MAEWLACLQFNQRSVDAIEDACREGAERVGPKVSVSALAVGPQARRMAAIQFWVGQNVAVHVGYSTKASNAFVSNVARGFLDNVDRVSLRTAASFNLPRDRPNGRTHTQNDDTQFLSRQELCAANLR